MAPSGVQRRMTASQIFLKDLNPLLICTLCRGYLIDATSLVDCFHIFCRACILRYFDNFKLACPTCGVICKKKSNCYRSDPVIQSLVYKLVPGLYSKEVQRREDFYRSTGVRASSSCSEDSVLGDLNDEHEEWVLSTCGDQNQYLSPEDAISLSLEYYNPHLDTCQNSPCSSTNCEDSTKTSDVINSANLSAEKTYNCDSNNSNVNVSDSNNDNDNDDKTSENSNNKHGLQSNIFDELSDTHKGDRRYLQCPAAVSMTLLHKFLRMKYALSPEHRVDIIYSGEILPQHFTLMDVAYTFQWKRVKPMRFFYRIFIPAKIQPIKIISTPSGDGKQLQVVLAKPSSPSQTVQDDSTKDDCVKVETEAENYINKERLMTNLQLQCKVKSEPAQEESNCVFEYEEPDKDEIREFAEKRDREWALQKKLDEEKEKHRNGKKRKKNKHSKNNVLYKKRKLHAEITSSESLQKEESLKLKVKLTPHNGYKHKHHKSSQSNVVVDAPKPPEMSSKEKLLQMRQVRHKHIPLEDRMKNTAHVVPLQQEEAKIPTVPENTQRNEETPPNQNVEKSPACESSGKTLRSDFSVKTKEIFMQKYPTVQIERNEQTEKHAQKTFLKTFQSYTEKLPQQDKTSSSPKSRSPAYTAKTQAQPQLTKSLEEKIANLHQQCTTIEPKPITVPESPKLEKKYFTSEKSYSTGFTVSKVEVGGKRNPGNENSVHDKRPSLEITLINPPHSPEKPKPTPIAKRPPPPTIPLERIKKSMNRISGLSIIPKLPEKCDNTGALDLSKPNRNADLPPKPCDPPNKILNGFNHPAKPPERAELSNLQMLSKVATEHPNINKNALLLNKRLPLPNLQTLKIPAPQNSTPKSNLAKLPKLNEISKTQFRLTNPQMRNMRPNQNQSIRNIPNPSLLVRQQNQNRLNSLNTQNQTETKALTTNGESEKSESKS